jgi:hypothetical protein
VFVFDQAQSLILNAKSRLKATAVGAAHGFERPIANCPGADGWFSLL